MGKYNKEVRSYADKIMRYIQFNLTEERYPNYGSYSISPNDIFNKFNNETSFERSSYMSKVSVLNESINSINHMDTLLDEFKVIINEINDENGFNGQNCQTASKWKFTSALL